MSIVFFIFLILYYVVCLGIWLLSKSLQVVTLLSELIYIHNAEHALKIIIQKY